MSSRSKFEIIVDAVVALLTDKLFLLVVFVLGASAIYGQEYVGGLMDMIGDLFSRAKR